MGPPYRTAARYREGQSFLIGPELFELYRLILMIAGGAVSLGLLISHIIGLLNNTGDAFDLFKEFLGFFPALFSALLAMVGAVTIVFFLIQRFGKMKTDEDYDLCWTPDDLPELPKTNEKVRLWEPLAGLFFITLAAVLLNSLAYGNLADRLSSPGNNFFLIGIFNLDSIRHFTPYWNLSLGLGVVLNGFLIPIGRRDRQIRLIEMVTNLYDITVLVMMIKGPFLFNLDNIRDFFNPSPESGLYRILAEADGRLDKLFTLFIILTAIGFTANLIKAINAGSDS